MHGQDLAHRKAGFEAGKGNPIFGQLEFSMRAVFIIQYQRGLVWPSWESKEH